MAGTVSKCKTPVLASSPSLSNVHRHKETTDIPKILTEIMTIPSLKIKNPALILGYKKIIIIKKGNLNAFC